MLDFFPDHGVLFLWGVGWARCRQCRAGQGSDPVGGNGTTLAAPFAPVEVRGSWGPALPYPRDGAAPKRHGRSGGG